MTLPLTVAPPAPLAPLAAKNIQFLKRGEVVCLSNVPPSRTLLEVLREDLGCTGTKEGCGEGDCGACTVVLGEAVDGALSVKAVNSCIRLAHSVDGMALWTIEDIASETTAYQPDALQAGAAGLALLERRRSGPLGGEAAQAVSDRGGILAKPGPRDWLCQTAGAAAPSGDRELHAVNDRGGHLHPAQAAMVQCHGSQCGFCTPGFVMSMFALYENKVCQGQTISRELAQEALSGNLCRCTGYRPILEASQHMAALPRVAIDRGEVLQKLEQLAPVNSAVGVDLAYQKPRDLASLLAAKAASPSAQVVAGCTDVGLWVTKQHRQFDHIIDVSQVKELRQITHHPQRPQRPQHTAIGAAVTLTDAFAALVAERAQLHAFTARFAGLSIRNSGTLGGNIAGGSPIGDAMPLLIALGASVVLMSVRGSREFALEDFYTGYKKNQLAPDEVLAWINVPKVLAGERVAIYKISKRFDDDISAVCLAVNLQIADGVVTHASIGVGGVAATPVRAVKTQAALAQQAWSQATVAHAMEVLRSEFTPISDMRASAAYRVQVLGNLLQRFWLESQGVQHINLQHFTLEAAL